MLLLLRIENFALIDYLEIELSLGLNVFTGETGAGKSIILDAVDAVLGGKIDRRIVRTGEQKAHLEATFEIDSRFREWFERNEIDLIDGSLMVCSREITLSQGKLRTRSRINGILVARKLVDELRDRFVELTAQGQTVQLGQPSLQREWLDLYGGSKVVEVTQAVATAYTTAQAAASALENRRQFEQQRLQRLDLLQYQTTELDQANLSDPEELKQLQIEHQRLNHVVQLQQDSYHIYQILYQNEQGLAVADLLGQVETLLMDMVEYDPLLKSILSMVEDAATQVTEAGRQIGSYGENLESDPQRLQDVESRIDELKLICRKYGKTLADVIDYYQIIQEELKDLQDNEQSIEALEKAYQTAQKELQEHCDQLTQLRQRAAVHLETDLVTHLKPLGMNNVKFKVEIIPISPNITGADKIRFCFSPNPGEPLKALSETASGGEMSRFLLALKACFSQIDGIGTLIFDEIDVGVSGRVAGAIAQKLYQLSQHHQVLCVTHQPIVAAMGDRHFHVRKEIITADSNSTAEEQRTVVRVNPLKPQQRRQELAQIASGESAQEAIAFAESLLTQAAALRRSSSNLEDLQLQ